MIVGPIRVYAHADSHYEYIEDYMKQGLSREDAKAFAAERPLYEVEVEFMVDTDKGVAYAVKVDIGDGEPPFTRPYPGQQLSILE